MVAASHQCGATTPAIRPGFTKPGGGAVQKVVGRKPSLLDHGFQARKKKVSRSLCSEFEQKATASPLWCSNRARARARAPIPAHVHLGGGSGSSAQKSRFGSAFQQGHIAATCDMHLDLGSGRKPTPIPPQLQQQQGMVCSSGKKGRRMSLLCVDMASVLSFEDAALEQHCSTTAGCTEGLLELGGGSQQSEFTGQHQQLQQHHHQRQQHQWQQQQPGLLTGFQSPSFADS